MPSVRAGASNIASAAIPPASSPGWSRSSSSQFCRSRKKGAPPPPAGDSAGRRKLGRNWVHAALAVVSRFLIDLRLGPRTLESAAEVLARGGAGGKLVRVRVRRLFGHLKELPRRIRQRHIGQDINPAHVERLNGTIRGQVARLARRTRHGSRRRRPLQWALWLWRGLYNWVRPPGSLDGRTPAMAPGPRAA